MSHRDKKRQLRYERPQAESKTKLRVLLVDDHKVVRDGIKFSFRLQKKFIVQTDEAECGGQAVAMARHFNYDIILMDIQMPDMDGIETTRKIIGHNREAKILTISMFEEEFFIRAMLQAGARGYLLKNTGTEELVKAVTEVLSGGKYFSSEVSIRLLERSDTYRQRYGIRKNNSKTPVLSGREHEVLALIAKQHTSNEIASLLNVAKRTIDTHRQNIMKKLKINNVAGLVMYAMQGNKNVPGGKRK